ncbi:hypothetical protein HK101_006278, partial [Irineochytrium annulatum]
MAKTGSGRNYLAESIMKDVVVVTSKGTFIVKCPGDATVAWTLDAATTLMMQGSQNALAGSSEAVGSNSDSRTPLVAARTADGTVARDDEKIFNICKENKILFAITADEVTNIPPAFQNAFAANGGA